MTTQYAPPGAARARPLATAPAASDTADAQRAQQGALVASPDVQERGRAPGPARWRSVATVVTLLVVTLLAEWPLLHGRVVAGLDSLTQFYPWYELVGAALREGRLPGWNPHTMAGSPLAGNPLSGWAYLPAMLAFTFLPFDVAVVVYQLAHALLATLSAYALARALGLGRAGAALAALGYGQSGLIAVEAACCFAFVSVGAWLPLLLLGAELAIRAAGWPVRIRGWSLSALALSQILAAWLGQGSYYALLVFGSFVTFRVLSQWSWSALWPARWDAGAGRHRATHALTAAGVIVGRLALHGAIPLILGLGLAAAGLLPRVELNLLSSLAGGYSEEDQQVGGWTVPEWLILAEPGFWYVGLAIIGLAPLAVWAARRRPLTWYLLALGATLLLLAMPAPSPVHDLFGLLPGFSRLHPHLPDRIITVFMLAPVLLAGLTLDAIVRMRPLGPFVAACLIAAVVADLRAAREKTFAGYDLADGVHRLMSVDVSAYYAPAPAARFLQERLREDGPFRSLGYQVDPSGRAYTQRYDNPATVLLGVNNRAVSDRLLDVQGYDAIHIARFDAYLRAANHESQNYHNADIFARGLRSPLLGLLSARYIVTPTTSTPPAPDDPLADPRFRLVFDDGVTRVLENEAALPWAWIVHEARPASVEEALDLLERGAVDPRQTALLEPPIRSPLAPPALVSLGGVFGAQAPASDVAALSEALRRAVPSSAAPSQSAVSILEHSADRIRLRATASADGVLVLSEVAYPGWEATIDGTPAPIYVANGLFRAIPLPAGEPTVELRFTAPTLRAGVVISLVTGALLLAVLLTSSSAPLLVSGRRRAGPSRSDPSHPGRS